MIETLPLAALTIRRGTVNGLTRLDAARDRGCVFCSSSVSIPPMPLPMITPQRKRIFLGEIDAGILHRVDRCGHAELAEAIEPLGLADVDAVFGDVEVGAFAAECERDICCDPSG